MELLASILRSTHVTSTVYILLCEIGYLYFTLLYPPALLLHTNNIIHTMYHKRAVWLLLQ
jgi:hypothetical protein